MQTGKPRRAGYTLLEVTIALSVWMILAASACQILVYTTRGSARIIDRQDAFENARAALDAIIVNIEMAETVLLETKPDGTLKKLTLTERAPNGFLAKYIFYYDGGAQPGEAKYRRLEFGLNDEFASRITALILTQNMGRIFITVEAAPAEGPGIVLSASVDVRYKDVTVVKQA